MSLRDPIVDTIHEFRAEHAAAFNYDVGAIVRDLVLQQEEAKAHGRQFVSLPGKKCKPGLRYTPIEETPVAQPTSTLPLAPNSTPSTQTP